MSLGPWADTLWKITKAGDALAFTFGHLMKLPGHGRGSLGRIILHTVEIESCSEADAVFQVFDCDDSHVGTRVQNR